jgi:hypothetical protein
MEINHPILQSKFELGTNLKIPQYLPFSVGKFNSVCRGFHTGCKVRKSFESTKGWRYHISFQAGILPLEKQFFGIAFHSIPFLGCISFFIARGQAIISFLYPNSAHTKSTQFSTRPTPYEPKCCVNPSS